MHVSMFEQYSTNKQHANEKNDPTFDFSSD